MKRKIKGKKRRGRERGGHVYGEVGGCVVEVWIGARMVGGGRNCVFLFLGGYITNGEEGSLFRITKVDWAGFVRRAEGRRHWIDCLVIVYGTRQILFDFLELNIY